MKKFDFLVLTLNSRYLRSVALKFHLEESQKRAVPQEFSEPIAKPDVSLSITLQTSATALLFRLTVCLKQFATAASNSCSLQLRIYVLSII